MAVLGSSTVAQALEGAATAFAAAGLDTPRLDAEVLLAHVLSRDRSAFWREPRAELPAHAVRPFQDAVRRRSVLREPVAYITCRKDFRHLELEVDARVLVPRPETEHLVEVGLELPARTRVHDLGTGSGAIALALKAERPDLVVSASDVSPDAVAVARRNRERLGLDITLSVGGWGCGFAAAEAILCNPPYVAAPEADRLAPELRHEPPQALFAGADGLDAVREIAGHVARRRTPLLIALEVGAGQAGAVGELLRRAGCTDVQARPDLAGIERVVAAWRR